MLKFWPIMVAPIMLKILALFLSSLCTCIDTKEKEKKGKNMTSVIYYRIGALQRSLSI